MDIIERCFERARAKRGRVVLPEGKDARVVAAARRLVDEGLALPVVLGKVDQVRLAAAAAGVTLDGIETARSGPQRSRQ